MRMDPRAAIPTYKNRNSVQLTGATPVLRIAPVQSRSPQSFINAHGRRPAEHFLRFRDIDLQRSAEPLRGLWASQHGRT